MSDLSPSQFETPGNPADTLPEISATQSPSGSGGRAETANNEGESILGAEERVLADEAGEGPLVTTLATAGHPTSGTWKTGQSVVDSNGVTWNCTAGGTPGTWVQSVLVPSNNLSDVANAATALGNLGGAAKYAVTVGDGSSLTYTVTHNLGTSDVQVSVISLATTQIVFPTVSVVNANEVSVAFSVAPAANTMRVVVGGF